MSVMGVIGGAARYEFRMQLRRRALWVVVGLFAPLALTGTYGPWKTMAEDGRYGGWALMLVIAQWAVTIQAFMPIAFGVMLADRLPRDRRTGGVERFAAVLAPARWR